MPVAHDGPVTEGEFVVGGYVLTVPSEAPSGMSTVPATMLTISDCIQTTLPRPQFWDWFTDLREAERAVQTETPHTQITAVAFRPADALAFMDEMGGADQPYFALLQRSVRLDGGLVGYEVVGAEATLDFHSWHCHGYADEVSEALGIRVNDLGLLPTYKAATAVLNWMLGRPASEAPAPVPWAVIALGSIDR